MSQKVWTAVDRYFADLLQLEDPALQNALRTSSEAGLPQIQVTPNVGKLLMMLARMQGARSILEIGTLGGYSTIWLARGMAEGGRLITLEADPNHARIAQANIAQAGLAQAVHVRVGLALDSLPRLAADRRGPFDLIFIDADKPNNPEYFTWAMKLSRRGTLIIIDNVVRDGAVIDASSKDASVKGVRKLNEMMAAEKRVSATAIQTVGAKGYDGLAMALVVDGPAARGSRAYT